MTNRLKFKKLFTENFLLHCSSQIKYGAIDSSDIYYSAQICSSFQSFSRNIAHKLAFIIVSCWILSSDFSLTLQPSFSLHSNAQNCPKFQSILASRAKIKKWEELWEIQLQSNLNLQCFNRFSLPTTPKWVWRNFRNTLDSQITQLGYFMDSKYIILKRLICQEHD